MVAQECRQLVASALGGVVDLARDGDAMLDRAKALVAAGASVAGETIDRAAGLAGAVNIVAQHVLGQHTLGACVGASGDVGAGSGSLTGCVVRAPDGEWALTGSVSATAGPGAGLFFGAGPLISNGQTVDAQEGTTVHGEVSGAVGPGGSVSHDVGPSGTWTSIPMAGVGTGAGTSAGAAHTGVLPLTGDDD
ncbi:hypothetical protein CFN78_03700 [Amycolatopsis antarctica]|uniref:Uncharacterized protein n=1 Tax=Amycolatopsis antarctica TaxID=1854586 RepID=A0A263D7U4_9PSEU|nr:hypothetical protein [Amycolatopsis antarctica]OZM74259.1 hypothetical protein CFN78_03700 [Amycolatopsis antarctica]